MESSYRPRWFAWLQLVRLPNVFTAAADVAMGYLVTHDTLRPATHFALLAAASCLLYLSGMVLNDVFDADADARERPERPIPSGRVAQRRRCLWFRVTRKWHTRYMVRQLRRARLAARRDRHRAGRLRCSVRRRVETHATRAVL